MGSTAASYAPASLSCGIRRVTNGNVCHTASHFGDLAVVAFLLAQAADGVLTYVGVRVFGPGIEANPLISWLIVSFGEAQALAGAKLVAGCFGIVLHLSAVHRLVAGLAVFYFAVAVCPWVAILYM